MNLKTKIKKYFWKIGFEVLHFESCLTGRKKTFSNIEGYKNIRLYFWLQLSRYFFWRGFWAVIADRRYFP